MLTHEQGHVTDIEAGRVQCFLSAGQNMLEHGEAVRARFEGRVRALTTRSCASFRRKGAVLRE